MTPLNRTLIGLTVVACGAAAAIPFRRTPAPPAAGLLRQPSDVVWRPHEEQFDKDQPTSQPEHQPAANASQSREEATLADSNSRPPDRGKPSKMSILFEGIGEQQPQAANPTPQVALRLVEPVKSKLAAAATVGPAARPQIETFERLHRIIDGDTLEKLALRYLGSAERWREIYDSNRELLESPQLLPIGTTLRIQCRRR